MTAAHRDSLARDGFAVVRGLVPDHLLKAAREVICSFVNALRTGTANIHNELVRRGQRPVYYWTAALGQAASATVAQIAVARLLSR